MSDQLEYQCPQCKRRTVVPADKATEEIVFCPKCEVAMAKKAKTSQVAEASANAPTASSNVVATATATAKKTKSSTKSATSRATKTKATGTRASRAATVAAPAVAVVIPEFGNFRCPCCGIAKTIMPGEFKAGTVHRCTTCFVKLDFLK